jgi:hypothetical protein
MKGSETYNLKNVSLWAYGDETSPLSFFSEIFGLILFCLNQ